MTTSFRAKFPARALANLRVFGREQNPAEWAKQTITGLKAGDIIVCFNPVRIENLEQTELEAGAMILVFNVDALGPMGILVTEDFYVVGTVEAIFRERAVGAAARGLNFSCVSIAHTGRTTEDAIVSINNMQRYGSGGTRANPMHGLQDPVVSFMTAVGVAVPAEPPLTIGVLANALIAGVEAAGIKNLSGRYENILKTGSTQAISTVTVIEEPTLPPASRAVSDDPAQTQRSLPLQEVPEGKTAPAAPKTPAPVPPAPVPPAPVPPAPVPPAPVPPAPVPPAPVPPAPVPPAPVPPEPKISVAERKTESISAGSAPQISSTTQSPAPASSGTSPLTKSPLPGQADAESGFLSIRKRLEARLSGRLPRTQTDGSEAELPAKSEHVSPVLKLVSNIRQQMSIASDNLEYRVSTLKSKMLDRLVSCKHNLSEKEQSSLKTLEDLRLQMHGKLEELATSAKEELSACASQGSARVRSNQTRATGSLNELLAEQEQVIAQKTDEAKRKVNESLAATKDELNKTVSRAQHTLRGAVTSTEVNLHQLVNLSSESMDERIAGFRAQTQILAEGIGLSVESLGEASKLQAHQSEDEVVKRLESITEEALKSLREQSVRAEMECSKLIDKLAREKLVPTLQDKRKIVVELAAFYHDEFANAMADVVENKLAEFEPMVRMNSDACTSSLQEFKSLWASNLEQHQKDLDEKEQKLRIQVEEFLSTARSKVESLQDITRITDHVLTSPELIRTRDETCLKFDIVAREHISKAYAMTGDKVQVHKQSSVDELIDVRETGEAALKTKGESSRTKIRASIKNAMQKIQDLQSKYTS